MVSYAVWTVACLSNGDIAAGTSDGLIRVFTRSEERVADAHTLTVRPLPRDDGAETQAYIRDTRRTTTSK